MLSKNMITMQKDVFSNDIPTVVKGLLFLLSCLINHFLGYWKDKHFVRSKYRILKQMGLNSILTRIWDYNKVYSESSISVKYLRSLKISKFYKIVVFKQKKTIELTQNCTI